MTEIQQTVYVVEDDEAVRDSLELLLKSDGKAVATYPSATDFLGDYSEDMAAVLCWISACPGWTAWSCRRNSMPATPYCPSFL